jgi:hypothetical protein
MCGELAIHDQNCIDSGRDCPFYPVLVRKKCDFACASLSQRRHTRYFEVSGAALQFTLDAIGQFVCTHTYEKVRLGD